MRQNGFRHLGLLTVLAAAAVTGACSGLRDNLGLNKASPDEFQVVSREPLTIPPEFRLRPPQPGTPRPQTGTTRDQAQEAVFRQDKPENGTLGYESDNSLSAGEQTLLARAGAGKTPENIREIVTRESAQLETADRNFVDRLIFWRQQQAAGKVVDAEKEAKRLRENAALGQDVTEGETPSIERGERGFLEGIF